MNGLREKEGVKVESQEVGSPTLSLNEDLNGYLPTPALSPITELVSTPEDGEIALLDRILTNGSTNWTGNSGAMENGQEEVIAVDSTAESKHGVSNTPRPADAKRRRSISKVGSPTANDKILKLSPAQIEELTNSPTSLPLRRASPVPEEISLETSPVSSAKDKYIRSMERDTLSPVKGDTGINGVRQIDGASHEEQEKDTGSRNLGSYGSLKSPLKTSRPTLSSRAVSTPPTIRRKQSSIRSQGTSQSSRPIPPPLHLDEKGSGATTGTSLKPSPMPESAPSPMPPSIPLPPLSIPTYLQLELSSERPSPLYIYRPSTSDFPYESSKVKFERLVNFLILPFQVEQTLWFGTLACLDAWLYTYTILPMRFFKALWVLGKWWSRNALKEVSDLASFVYQGLGRLWRRRKQKQEASVPPTPSDEKPPISTGAPQSALVNKENGSAAHVYAEQQRKQARSAIYRHRRTKSTPSLLMPSHKADLLKGLLVLTSCVILMRFDASRMYHNIRGQAAIKLYVIYNVLEVCDRLFSALGQDVLECLFSRETLERHPDGRSKVIRPFWMFLLALFYNVVHAAALFYQVITLNVAVNSYSNALLTLLLSNQFVEIKGTVFKKFEKENLFQLTCADVVERFQLWLMLTIIAMRNIVEVGGFSISLVDFSAAVGSVGSNTTSAPVRSSSIIPQSFTLVPVWAGQVFGPFLVVLGSEMLVDWLKHAYITKFNNVKPAVYGRFLDVLAKDYYSHAFADQNLTKRLGLPVLPLACLFIRALVQTYHMFLATHMPLPIPSTATSLSTDSAATSSPATTAALAHIDHIFRRALGRSSFGAGASPAAGLTAWFRAWTIDDAIAFATMAVVFLIFFFLLLALKLVLGMLLLSFARRRYRDMKVRESQSYDQSGNRVGGWGVVEVEDDKKRWIYADDPEGLKVLREREQKQRDRERKGETVKLEGVSRYSMAAKRIW